jgi:1,4-dihydroxy-2-naphthoyl-CoA hydrolase
VSDLPLQSSQRLLAGTLPGLLGVVLVRVAAGAADARLPLRPELLAPNGFVHAGTVVTLADTACGMGCLASLPAEAESFTTIELKANFVRTAPGDQTLTCAARMVHGGRSTQVWDATVTREGDGRPVALFRCTQHLLRAGGT